MTKNNKNHKLIEMRDIYYPLDKRSGENYLDWMGYQITNKNKATYHHIVKASVLRSEGKNDEATISNGAYLGVQSHRLLHKLEDIDVELYDAWNYLFLLINRMKCYPIGDVWKMVFSLQDLTNKKLESYYRHFEEIEIINIRKRGKIYVYKR